MDLRRFFLFVVFFLGTFFLLGNLALAKDDSSSSGTSENAAQSEASGDSVFDYAKEPAFKGLVPCGTDENNVPCSLCHFIIGIQRIFKYGLYLSTTLAFAGLFIIGLMYLFSFGSEEMMTKAKLFLWLTLKGFGITLGSWVIITSILNIVPISQGLGVNKVNWYTFSCNISTDNVGTGPANIDKGKLESLEIQCESGSASDITLDDDPNTDKPDNYQLKAIAKYSSGDSEDVTQKATWSAVDETIAKVSSGKVQGIKIGYTSIKASYAESGSESQAAGVNIFMNTCPLNLAPDDEEEEESEKTSSIFQYPLKPDNIFKKLTNSAYAASGGSGCKVCVKKKWDYCKLVAGKADAKFVFVLAKGNLFSDYQGACYKVARWGDKSFDDQDEMFQRLVAHSIQGLKSIDSKDRSEFAIYKSNLVYEGKLGEATKQLKKDCFLPANNLVFSVGFVQLPKEGTDEEKDNRSFALLSENITVYCASNIDLSGNVFTHEQIGHNLMSFNDEYEESEAAKVKNGKKVYSSNCTTNSKCEKWSGITTGCYEGCLYMKKGVYRSSFESVMRNSWEYGDFSSFQKKLINDRVRYYPTVPTQYSESITIKAW